MTVVIDSTCKVGMELFLLQNNKKIKDRIIILQFKKNMNILFIYEF